MKKAIFLLLSLCAMRVSLAQDVDRTKYPETFFALSSDSDDYYCWLRIRQDTNVYIQSAACRYRLLPTGKVRISSANWPRSVVVMCRVT